MKFSVFAVKMKENRKYPYQRNIWIRKLLNHVCKTPLERKTPGIKNSVLIVVFFLFVGGGRVVSKGKRLNIHVYLSTIRRRLGALIFFS